MPERNLKLLIAYDGHPYSGWQVQPDRPTVQEHIEQAIFKITQQRCRLANAGRTDTGVHALGQVASFRTDSQIPCEKLRPALQSQLPYSIVIRDVAEVPHEFHAGFAAKWKLYRYLIWNDRVMLPHLRHYATQVADELDVAAMNAAAAHLIGKHDFRSFESQFPNKASSVRTVLYCRLSRSRNWPIWGRWSGFGSQHVEPVIQLDIVADGFLYNMVRAIMGTLLKVGSGSWEADAVLRILEIQDRRQAGPTAPPQGLYLMHVEYERSFKPELIAEL